MQLITLAAAAALLATTSATGDVNAFNFNGTCDTSKPKVRVTNRCSYKVHLWSVLKGQGCPADESAVLEPGAFYQENFREENNVGVSLKISKTSECKGVDTVQLEYFMERTKGEFNYNYLDVSYVDCTGEDCPTKQEGYYLKSGNQDGQYLKNSLNQICPILSCSNAAECATMSYILPDDVQTKSCDLKADLDFYMCGGEAPGEETQEPSEPAEPSAAPSSSQEQEQPEPTSATYEAPAYSQEADVAAAEVTPAPVQPSKAPNVKTEVVYVTQYEYVNAKRHAHGHRHQHFRA